MSTSIPLPLLDRLPTEVLYTVAKDLRQHDLNSWSRVCKALHSALNPLLWKTLTIREKDEGHLGLDIDPFLRTYTYCPTHDHLQYVKNVIVTTPRYQDMSVKCAHRNLEIRMLYDVSSGQSLPNLVDRLALNLLPLTRHLRDNQLQSFSWNAMTCLPSHVAPLFGPRGYIPLKQSSIESLSLVTGGLCMWTFENPSSLGLENLKRLRHFSWKALSASAWMEDLRGVIACNAVHLQSLTLDVDDWNAANHPPRKSKKRMLLSERRDDDEDFTAEEEGAAEEGAAEEEAAEEEAAKEETAWKPSINNFLAWKVLHLQPRTDLVVFPTLTELSLSHISFEGAITELISAFNVDMLRSLKLESCGWCPEFLLALADSPKRMRLKVFHLSMSDWKEELRPIETFLEAFAGLEELGLLIEDPLATPKYWNAVLNHKSTLKYFVYHEKIEQRYPRHISFVDRCPLLRKSEDDREALGNVFEELLAESDLECLAICGNLSSLTQRLASMTPRSAIKLLHVRISGENKKQSQIDLIMRNLPDTLPHTNLPWDLTPSTRQRMSHDPHRAHQIPHHYDLASWAFSPDGLPNLQVLAHGDFSHSGRYVEDSFIFGRDGAIPDTSTLTVWAGPKPDAGFSLLGQGARNEVVARYGDFLSACPVDPLMR
ncbi:hypothetical protein BDR22DRAFT_962536 [Usnea florida]